jgi:hypothetical protein
LNATMVMAMSSARAEDQAPADRVGCQRGCSKADRRPCPHRQLFTPIAQSTAS